MSSRSELAEDQARFASASSDVILLKGSHSIFSAETRLSTLARENSKCVYLSCLDS